MRERGTLQQTADWLDTQLATFAGILAELGDAVQPRPGTRSSRRTCLNSARQRCRELAQQAFGLDPAGRRLRGRRVIVKVLELVKQALLAWLSENAHRVPGFHLLTVILGPNPFTGEEVPRTAGEPDQGLHHAAARTARRPTTSSPSPA